MNNMKKVFIDGGAGTTGLRIYERLEKRTDIELIRLDDEQRKDAKARFDALNSCDIAFLCLPDDAAREAVAMTVNPGVKIIDTSTAHRTGAGFAYGFPELGQEFRENIKNGKRIAVPGCHASGFISLVFPLVKAGIIPRDAHLYCHSVTGYSGGGKKMIVQYEDANRNPLLDAPRQYGITQNHKHLKEMTEIPGLVNKPIFSPVVSDFYSGMCVSVPLFAGQINGIVKDIKDVYCELYDGSIVGFTEKNDSDGFLSAAALSGSDRMEISVYGNDDRIILVSTFDNIGKGASGAAIQCMNILCGMEETAGLQI